MKLLSILILPVFCLNLYGQKDKAVTSTWRNNASEAKIPDSDYAIAKKGAVLYYVSNDENNLYIDMKVKETIEQNHILQLGMTVWLNPDGKSHKEMGLRFPIGSQYMRRGGRGAGMNDVLNAPTPLSQANTIELVGFKDAEAKRIPSDNLDNFRGSVKYDKDGNLIYNLIIPLVKLPFRNDASSTGQLPFTIGIEYGAPPVMTGGPSGPPSGAMPSGNMRRGSGGGGGSRGGSGGGGGGGMPSGGVRPSSGQPAVTPVMIWIKDLTLAKKN